MKFKVKILTDEFFTKVNLFVKKEIEKHHNDNLFSYFIRDSLREYWRNPNYDAPTSNNIMDFPHFQWKGHIMPANEIDEFLSWEMSQEDLDRLNNMSNQETIQDLIKSLKK